MALSTKITRKVYFFRLAEHAEVIGKLEKAVAFIDELPFNDQGRYQAATGDDTVLAVFVTKSTYPIMIQFARIRRDNLPLVERQGAITPLSLAEDAGLMDWSHIVIFPDGIVAAEFVQDAPRIRRLGQYLLFKAGGHLSSAPKFLPLFQRNVINELEKFESVTILELEASNSDAELIGEGDAHIGEALKACRSIGGVRRSQITLKTSGSKSIELKTLARRLFSNVASRESLFKLKLVGRRNGERKPLDMLDEYLLSTEQFVKIDPRFRAICADDAFSVLQRAYIDSNSKFASAVTANERW